MKKRRLSILLSIVMLFSLLPTTALAATYPESVRVYNGSGTITSLSDGQCLATNAATSAIAYTSGDTYVARYDSGKLYLNGYQNGNQIIAPNSVIFADGDLNIEVVSDSSFSTSVSATNDLYGIQANGKLNISGSGKLTVTANGNGDVYGIYADKGVTISAPLDVQVGKVDSSKNGSLYGIYTKSGAISLPGNDMTVTATGGTSTVYGVFNAADTSAIADNGNITISGKLTMNLSNGSYNRGISSQGGVITLNGATVKIPGSYYYGIFNKSGNVVIKSSPDVNISSDISDNRGICTYTGGDLTIENSTVKVSANGPAADLKGNVSIKDSMVELTRTSSYYEVIRTDNSSATITIDLSTEGSVTLTASGEQTNNAMITGKVTLVGSAKCEKGRRNGSSYDGVYDGSGKTVLQFVHESTAPAATVDDVTITGEKDSLITNKEVKIMLTNDKFNAIPATTNVKSWFTNLPAGLEAKIKADVSANETTATVEISGIPTETSSAALVIRIPAGNLVTSTSGLDVTSNTNAKYNITAPATSIAVPTANSVTYNGTKQTGVRGDTGYTLGGDYEATDVGATDYTATATLNPGYKWDDDSTGDKTITWNIGKKAPTVTDFNFVAPTDLIYDGTDKTASVTLKSPLTKSGAISVKYEKSGTAVTETKDVGTYTVKIDVAGGENFEATSGLTASAWTFSITPANQSAPTTLGVAAPTVGGSTGKITGTTTDMEYHTNAIASSGWTGCSNGETEVAPNTYYVRFKAKTNYNAGAVSAALVVPAYSATKYTVTVTSDANGTASADKTSVVAGETVTLTATPKSGYVFEQWADKTPNSLTIGADGKFTMPSENVRVKAIFKPAALTGTASITGTEKFGQTLTADATGITNNTGTLTYKWYRSGKTDAIATNTTGKYTLVAADIDKTITVKITSSVQSGEITGSATGTIEKADGPAEPSVTPVACTNSSNNDGKLQNVTNAMEYQKSGAGTWTACSGTEVTGLTNGTYYVRVAETTTRKAGTAATVIVPAYTASGTSSGGSSGGGYVPTTQKPDIKAGEGGSIALSKDGTTATITPNAGMMIDKVMLNGKDMGALTVVKGIKTGDKLEVSFKQTAEEKAKMDKAVAEQVGKAGLTARSARIAKKNVKLVVKSDLKGITDAGYTVEYKFYRSTKKSAGYKVMKTGKSGIYINTYGKKGTLYYYKVKVMVYDKDGNLTAQTALKQCKYASRLWTK